MIDVKDLKVTSKTYSVEIDRDDLCAIRDYEFNSMYNEALYVDVENIDGVYNCNYNAMYGQFISFIVDSEYDNEVTLNQVVETINDFIKEYKDNLK